MQQQLQQHFTKIQSKTENHQSSRIKISHNNRRDVMNTTTTTTSNDENDDDVLKSLDDLNSFRTCLCEYYFIHRSCIYNDYCKQAHIIDQHLGPTSIKTQNSHQHSTAITSQSHLPTVFLRRPPFFNPSKKTLRYLHSICRYVNSNSPFNSLTTEKCPRKASCIYAHSWEELHYHPLVYKTIRCPSEDSCCIPYCPNYHTNRCDKRDPFADLQSTDGKYTLVIEKNIRLCDPPQNIKIEEVNHRKYLSLVSKASMKNSACQDGRGGRCRTPRKLLSTGGSLTNGEHRPSFENGDDGNNPSINICNHDDPQTGVCAIGSKSRQYSNESLVNGKITDDQRISCAIRPIIPDNKRRPLRSIKSQFSTGVPPPPPPPPPPPTVPPPPPNHQDYSPWSTKDANYRHCINYPSLDYYHWQRNHYKLSENQNLLSRHPSQQLLPPPPPLSNDLLYHKPSLDTSNNYYNSVNNEICPQQDYTTFRSSPRQRLNPYEWFNDKINLSSKENSFNQIIQPPQSITLSNTSTPDITSPCSPNCGQNKESSWITQWDPEMTVEEWDRHKALSEAISPLGASLCASPSSNAEISFPDIRPYSSNQCSSPMSPWPLNTSWRLGDHQLVEYTQNNNSSNLIVSCSSLGTTPVYCPSTAPYPPTATLESLWDLEPQKNVLLTENPECKQSSYNHFYPSLTKALTTSPNESTHNDINHVPFQPSVMLSDLQDITRSASRYMARRNSEPIDDSNRDEALPSLDALVSLPPSPPQSAPARNLASDVWGEGSMIPQIKAQRHSAAGLPASQFQLLFDVQDETMSSATTVPDTLPTCSNACQTSSRMGLDRVALALLGFTTGSDNFSLAISPERNDLLDDNLHASEVQTPSSGSFKSIKPPTFREAATAAVASVFGLSSLGSSGFIRDVSNNAYSEGMVGDAGFLSSRSHFIHAERGRSCSDDVLHDSLFRNHDINYFRGDDSENIVKLVAQEDISNASDVTAVPSNIFSNSEAIGMTSSTTTTRHDSLSDEQILQGNSYCSRESSSDETSYNDISGSISNGQGKIIETSDNNNNISLRASLSDFSVWDTLIGTFGFKTTQTTTLTSDEQHAVPISLRLHSSSSPVSRK